MLWLRRASLLTLLLPVLFSSNSTAADLHDADARFKAFSASQRETYAGAIAEYRAAELAAPTDVGLAIARCSFIENFTYEDNLAWNEDAQTELDTCREQVKKKWPYVPAARVYDFENSAGADSVLVGKKLWSEADEWPRPLRARIATHMLVLLDEENDREAGRFAVLATELGNPKKLPRAIAYLNSQKQAGKAIRLAQAQSPATVSWQAEARINALAALADKKAARRELDRTIAAGVAVSADTRVNTYVAVGDLAAANIAAKDLGKTSSDDRTAGFRLAVANKDMAKASSFLSFDDEFPLWIERYALVLSKAPMQAFGSALLPGTLVLLLFMACAALLPGLLLIPVHYRGLMRRVNDRQPVPLFARIGLRHAWIGAAIGLLLPSVVAVFMRPDLVGALISETDTSAGRFDLYAGGVLVSLLALGPWLSGVFKTNLPAVETRTLRTLGAVVLCWLAVFLVGYLHLLFHEAIGSGDTSTQQTELVDALVRNSTTDYGMFWTLMLMSVAVPVFEEIVFRGMLLGGMARHISFGWANTLQAALFAASHFDEPRFFLYFTLGLLAGWLVRRSGRLWPAIALHALNNTMATLLF